MRDNILATLAYYDILDFPLKADEVLNYLVKLNNNLNPEEVSLGNIKRILNQLVLDGKVYKDSLPASEAGSYYFLDEKNYLVPLRLKREKISAQKWAKARKAIRWLRFIPYVEAVFASGSLALNNCDELSDLDVLIVTKYGRIWLTRLLVSSLLSLIRIRRRYFQKIAPDKICLNHYITDQSLKIQFESMYNAQNYLNLKPILLRDQNIINEFFSQNSWLGDYIFHPHPKHYDTVIYYSVGAKVLGFLLDSKFGDWLEKLARNYQIRRITKNPLTKAANGHVVFDDNQLAFHPDSPEGQITTQYFEVIKYGS